jgi:hypothetical protein
MTFAEPTELEGAAVHMPDPIIKFFAADIFATAGV